MLIKLSSSIRDYYGLVAMAAEQNSTVLVRSMVMVVGPLILFSRRGEGYRALAEVVAISPFISFPSSK